MIKLIKNNIQKALKELKLDSNLQFNIWTINNISKRFKSNDLNLKNSHYESNLLMIIKKKYNLDQKEINTLLEKLIKVLQKNSDIFDNLIWEKSLNSNQGYHYLIINIKNNYLFQVLNQILKLKNNFGKLDIGNQKKVNYEWVSANPTGFLHLGHARNIFVGKAIANILEFCNYQVTREFYINDHGNQVLQLGKTIYFYYLKELGLNPKETEGLYKNPEVKPLGKKAFDVFGTKYKTSDFENDKALQKIFIEFGTDYFLKEMQILLNKCEIKFDLWFSEKSLYKTEKDLNNLISRLKANNFLYEKEGAIWFANPSNQEHSNDFVLIKKDKTSTYFAGDIMYHDNKYKRGFDHMYDLWGTDHYGHFLKIREGLKALGWNSEKYEVDLLHMVKVLKDGEALKISKRQGTTIPIVNIIDEVGIDFLTFLLLFRKRNTKLEFDLNLAQEKNVKNPLFYTQYAYVRCVQSLNKSNLKPQKIINYQSFQKPIETNLILKIHELENVLERAVRDREPQYLVAYGIELAKLFHSFYEQIFILDKDLKIQQEKINLVYGTKIVFQNLFKLIGVNAPQKM